MHLDEGYAVEFSPDGSLMASSGENLIRFWETSSFTNTRNLTLSFGAISLAFSPDGSLFATGDGNGVTSLWNTATGSSLRNFSFPTYVRAIKFSPDGSLLASGGGFGLVKIWDILSGDNIRNLTHNGNVNSFEFSPDGSLIATGLSVSSGSTAPSLIIWNGTSSDSPIRSFITYNRVSRVVFNADGSLLSAASNGIILIVDPRNGKFI